MAIVSGDFAPVFNYPDDGSVLLDNPRDVHTVTDTGGTFLYVCSSPFGLSAYRVEIDGNVTFISNYYDDTTTFFGSPVELASVNIDDQSFLYVAGIGENAISVFSINSNGGLNLVQSVPDNGLYRINGTFSLQIEAIGEKKYMVSSGIGDIGFSLFEIGQNGIITHVSSTNNSVDYRVDDVVTVEKNGNTYFYAAGSAKIAAFEMVGEKLKYKFEITESSNPELHLNAVHEIKKITIGESTYLIAGGGDDGLSLFSVQQDGTLFNTHNFSAWSSEDGSSVGLSGNVPDIEIAYINGYPFIVATSAQDKSVAIFHLSGDGILSHVATRFDSDDAGAQLSFAYGVAFLNTPNGFFVYATGATEPGLSGFSLGLGNDILYAGNGGDTVFGFSGNDILYGGAGNDLLVGGYGDDTFVMSSLGADQIDGSEGLDYVSYWSSTQSLSIDLRTPSLNAGAAMGDTFHSVETFSLTNYNDLFFGNAENNFIYGDGGADFLSGGSGGDILSGGSGNDFISSGPLSDIISGGDGADTLYYAENILEQDQILDYVPGVDILAFSRQGFNFEAQDPFFGINFISISSGGTLNYAAVQSVIIYYEEFGLLYADTDGAGGNAPNLIAALGGTPQISVDDILFI